MYLVFVIMRDDAWSHFILPFHWISKPCLRNFNQLIISMEFHFGSTLPVKSCKIASHSYIFRAKQSAVYFLLNIVIVSLSYSSRYKCTIYWFFNFIPVISMENFFPSKVKQEMEFHFGSTLPVKSCKIASLSYTFRAKQCAVYFHLNIVIVSLLYSCRYKFFNCIPIISMQNFFPPEGETGNGISFW